MPFYATPNLETIQTDDVRRPTRLAHEAQNDVSVGMGECMLT